MANIPFHNTGLASAEQDVFASVELFAGDAPIITTPEIVAADAIDGVDLLAFTVVGRDEDGELIPAVLGSVEPVGITTATVLADSTARNVAMYRGGYFNINALNWPASYDTDAKKLAAFNGTVDTIYVRAIPNHPGA